MKVDIEKVDFASGRHKLAVLMLLDRYARHPMGQSEGLPASKRESIWLELGKRIWAHAFLAFREEKAVGMAICLEGFSTFQSAPLLNVHDLYVADEFQKQGVGRTLLEAVCAEAVGMGCCKVTLEVLQGNATAKTLYRHMGFSPYANPHAGAAEFWQKNLF